MHNQYDGHTHLFQKLYYHPGLLLEDEQALSNVYFKQNAAHEKLEMITTVSWVGALFPSLYYLSRSVRPYGCGLFTLGYLGAYSFAVRPMLRKQLQNTLNKSALPYKDKYNIKTDADYLPSK